MGNLGNFIFRPQEVQHSYLVLLNTVNEVSGYVCSSCFSIRDRIQEDGDEVRGWVGRSFLHNGTPRPGWFILGSRLARGVREQC